MFNGIAAPRHQAPIASAEHQVHASGRHSLVAFFDAMERLLASAQVSIPTLPETMSDRAELEKQMKTQMALDKIKAAIEDANLSDFRNWAIAGTLASANSAAALPPTTAILHALKAAPESLGRKDSDFIESADSNWKIALRDLENIESFATNNAPRNARTQFAYKPRIDESRLEDVRSELQVIVEELGRHYKNQVYPQYRPLTDSGQSDLSSQSTTTETLSSSSSNQSYLSQHGSFDLSGSASSSRRTSTDASSSPRKNSGVKAWMQKTKRLLKNNVAKVLPQRGKKTEAASASNSSRAEKEAKTILSRISGDPFCDLQTTADMKK